MRELRGVIAGGLFLMSPLVFAQDPAVVIHDHDALALSSSGDRIADVEADDPGGLPDEAHGHVVIRAANGTRIVDFDPCAACKYSDLAWSPDGRTLAFVARREGSW